MVVHPNAWTNFAEIDLFKQLLSKLCHVKKTEFKVLEAERLPIPLQESCGIFTAVKHCLQLTGSLVQSDRASLVKSLFRTSQVLCYFTCPQIGSAYIV